MSDLWMHIRADMLCMNQLFTSAFIMYACMYSAVRCFTRIKINEDQFILLDKTNRISLKVQMINKAIK